MSSTYEPHLLRLDQNGFADHIDQARVVDLRRHDRLNLHDVPVVLLRLPSDLVELWLDAVQHKWVRHLPLELLIELDGLLGRAPQGLRGRRRRASSKASFSSSVGGGLGTSRPVSDTCLSERLTADVSAFTTFSSTTLI